VFLQKVFTFPQEPFEMGTMGMLPRVSPNLPLLRGKRVVVLLLDLGIFIAIPPKIFLLKPLSGVQTICASNKKAVYRKKWM